MPNPALLKKEACSTKDFLKKAVLVWCCPAPGYIRGSFLFHVACTKKPKKPCACSCPPATPVLVFKIKPEVPAVPYGVLILIKAVLNVKCCPSTRLYKGDIFPFPGTPACGTGRSHPPFPPTPAATLPSPFTKDFGQLPLPGPLFVKCKGPAERRRGGGYGIQKDTA